MRIYFTFFNPYAWNFGVFYSTKYRRFYIQLIPVVLCMVVVIGRSERNAGEILGDALFGDFGDQP